MIRCTANVQFLFPGRPLAESIAAAVDAGFRTIEITDPFSMDEDELVGLIERHGLTVDLFNLPFGVLAAGDRGWAGMPSRSADFRAGVERSIRFAERLRVPKVNALTGRREAGETEEAQLDCLRENLAWAADRLAGAGTRVCTELLNPVETPGYLLSSLAVVRSVLEPLGGRVAFQFDVYHLQRTRGELIPAAAEMADLTGHVQVADAPGRNEPGTGEINVPNVLAALAANGYDGPVGLEYRPSGRTPDPFAWVEAAGYARI
ncbi:MAG: TIM barrel protein [Chloroflexota bacterium]